MNKFNFGHLFFNTLKLFLYHSIHYYLTVFLNLIIFTMGKNVKNLKIIFTKFGK